MKLKSIQAETPIASILSLVLTSETSTSANKAGAHNSERAFTDQINLGLFWSTFSRKSGMEAPSEYLIVRNDKKEKVDAIKTPEIHYFLVSSFCSLIGRLI